MSVFLSMFDMPDVAGVFCPSAPKVTDNPRGIAVRAKTEADKGNPPVEESAGDAGNGGVTQESAFSGKRHLPALYKLIESGKVLALNMPAGSNPALARAIGVMLKNAWLQAPAYAAQADEGIPKHLLPARCLYLRRVSSLRIGRRGRPHRR